MRSIICEPSAGPIGSEPNRRFFFFFSSFLSLFHFFLLLIRISGFQYQKDLPPFFILIFLGLSPSPDLAAPGAVSPIHLIPVLTTISIHLAILHLSSTGFPRLASLISARPASRLAIITRPTIAPWTLFCSCCLCGLRSDAAKLLRSRVAESSNPPYEIESESTLGGFLGGDIDTAYHEPSWPLLLSYTDDSLLTKPGDSISPNYLPISSRFRSQHSTCLPCRFVEHEIVRSVIYPTPSFSFHARAPLEFLP